MVFYFLLHSFIPHKEYRYIFLCLPLLMTCAAVGAGRLDRRLIAAALFAFVCFSLYAGARLTWGDLGYRSAFIDGRRSAWTVMGSKIAAYRYLSGRPDIRGLYDGVYNWHWSPGYYYLHRDVPLVFGPALTAAAVRDRRVNYFLSGQASDLRGLTLVGKIDDLFLYRNGPAAEEK